MGDLLSEILHAAGKHPNSRVSKLIQTVQADPSQKNIVLLLIELSEHAEYSVDFNISLKYYLDLFDSFGITSDLVLNEAGLLLLNSSKIYSKRVDYVQSLVERQILTLSNADHELQQQKLNQQEASAESATPVEKPKRGRKRALEVSSDPYEVDLAPKKFKKLSEEKRFAVQKTTAKAKSIQRNIEMEQHIHPAGWMHATIYDLDNEEDVDTKRNYKLFTYHIEHRYNTLVPDINFRLHFKVKDYIDAQEEEMDEDEACNTDRDTWPPLSEAYIQKYLKLENYVLEQDGMRSTKRKARTMDNDDDHGDERANNEDINQDKQLNNTANNMDISAQHLNTSIMNESKNDSGLGQSLLDESNKTNSTIDATQLDMANTSSLNNITLDSSSNNSNNLNDTNSLEADKSLNSTQSLQENDSALGTSLLDQSNNTELNSSSDLSGNLDKTSDLSDLSTSVLDQTNNIELNSSAETSRNLDATNGNETLNQTTDITTELSENLNATNCTETSLVNTENVNESREISISETENKTQQLEGQENKEISQLEKETTTQLKDNLDTNDIESKQLLKTTENRKDSALSDDRHFSISTENLAIMSADDAKILSDINLVENKDGDRSQIRIQLPNMDDEGVCLSDLEDQGMFSPTINITNILPGVKRKDITIMMDEELRQALELRDGIMEHFGRETYHVPVTTEPKKQNLYFNILKLPEKMIRKKVIFKLGPEMDLYLQARSLKRPRIDPQPREYRTTKLLQWFTLNNTDMSGIAMTPPNSPGHCSNFCGFTDIESDDDLSCSEFCGFSAEEQAAIQLTNLNRLSRDSGYGLDVNQLTPEKEKLGVIFETPEKSVTNLDLDNCKKTLNFDEVNESNNETTENILNQLSADIRDALNAEINDGETEKTATDICEKQTDTLVTEVSEGQTKTTDLEKSTNNIEVTETLSTEKSTELEQLNVANANEETGKLSLENSKETPINTIEPSSETILFSVEQQSDVELTKNLNPTQVPSIETNKDVDTPGDQFKKSEELNKTAENECETKNCDENNLNISDTFADHHAVDDGEDSEDETFIDLDTQGNKTKIQLWHEHLQPILAKSRERHHFDVFKLGTEIIETVQTKIQREEDITSFTTPASPPVALFHDIMDNKDKSYVSRYFLSTLLLANQSNVEISIKNKSSEQPSSWNDIQLKLLSTKRHTVAIEDNIGMIDNKKKADKKENEKRSTTKEKIKQTSLMEVDDEDDEEEDIPLVTLKTNKKSRMANKRTSDNIISKIAEKKPKEIFTNTSEKSNLRPHDASSANLITNVQILPTLKTTTTAPNDNISFSLSSKFPLPQFDESSMKPCTSKQALEVNLDALRTLQPIQKVPRNSDDYDSGIFSIDELST